MSDEARDEIEDLQARHIQSVERARQRRQRQRRPAASSSAPPESAVSQTSLASEFEDAQETMAAAEDESGAEEAKRTETDTPGRGGSGLAGEDADDDSHKFSTKVYLNEKSLVHMLSDNVRVNLKSGAKAVIDLFLSKLRQTESVAVAKYGTWEEYFLAGAKLDGYENLGRKLTDHLAAIHSVFDDELRSPSHWDGSTNEGSGSARTHCRLGAR